MKNLLKISFMYYIQSFAYMIPYMILSKIYSNDLTLAFGFIYPLQFLIYIVIYYVESIGTISVVKDNKSHKSIEAKYNRSSSLLIFLLFSIIFIILSILFVNDYLMIFGNYEYLSVSSICMIISFISYSTVWLISTLDVMINKNNLYYTSLLVLTSISSILLIFIIDLFTDIVININIISIIIALFNSILILYLVINYFNNNGLYKLNIKYFKLGLSSMPTIISNISYLIVYLLCYRRSGLIGVEEASVLAMLSIYGDSIWDAECSIPEYYMSLSDNGNKNVVLIVLKRSLLLSVIFVLLFIILSYISGLIFINPIIVTVNCLGLITLSIRDVYQSYCVVNINIKYSSVIFLLYAIIRCLLAFIIKDIYSSEYSMVISNLFIIIILYFIYRYNISKEY